MYAIILAGGSGTRLWPLSREQFPKQLINLTGSGNSLFQETINRAKTIVPEKRIIVVAHCEQGDIIKRQLDEIGLKKVTLLEEPKACNTAPAIGIAAWYIKNMEAENKSSLMLVLPSDHMIASEQDFAKLISQARRSATAYGLVTFGIRPTYPETGYGYICCGRQLNEQTFAVEKFTEKPKLALAKKYINDPRYLWNSGMFIFKVPELITQYRQYLPSLAAGLDKIDYQHFTNLEHIYSSFGSISIDYGLLEKTTATTVVPTAISWSDVGSWDAFYKTSPKDADGNYFHGRAVSMDTKGSLAFSPQKLVCLIGIKNLIVVAAEDALLVCSRGETQKVKKIVQKLKISGAAEHKVHPTVYRPWGGFTVLADQKTYKVKKIKVNPGSRLSLQSHDHRSEHWLIAKGQALVTVGEQEKLLSEGDYIFIPVNTRHRLENPGQTLLEVIEIQKGDYLGEDDIVRYENDYGRR